MSNNGQNDNRLEKLGIEVAKLHDDEAMKNWPTLLTMLLPQYSGLKTIKGGGSLSLSPKPEGWYVGLQLPHLKASGHIIVPSLTLVFDALEVSLNDHAVIWQPNWKKSQMDLKKLAEGL